MNRSEAVKVLKDVLEKCPSVDGAYIALMPSDSADLLSHGFQIHIKTSLSQEDRRCVQELLTKQGLKLKETPDKTIIYRPKM